MATTAHEVALGVSVDSKAAEEALKRLSTSLTDLGTTVSDKVISRFEKLNTVLSTFGSNASSAATGISSLNTPLNDFATALGSLSGSSPTLTKISSAIRSLSSASEKAATPIANLVTPISSLAAASITLNDFSTAVRSFLTSTLSTTRSVDTFSTALRGLTAVVPTVTDLGTAIGRLAVASSGVAGPLSSLVTHLGTFSAAVSTLNLGPIGAQLSTFGANIASIGAGAAGVTTYSRALAQMASAFTRLNAVDSNAIFTAQASGVRTLTATLGTALGPINAYATALQRIASASRSIEATSSSIGALSAQAAGIQLLSNAITINITALTAYAAAMRTVAIAMAGISRGTASLSRLVTGLNGISATSSSVVPALDAITAALNPLIAALRSAATAAQRLSTRLTALAISTSGVSSAITSVRASLGAFGGSLGVAFSIVSTLVGSLGRLGRAFTSVGRSSESASSSVKSSSSVFSTIGSVVGSLTGKIIGLVGAYAGAQAIKEFGEKILKTGANFDNAMGTVKAVSRNASDYSADAFRNMEREAFRMGRTTTYSATQAAEALKELTQGGLTTNQAVQSLGDTLSLAEVEAMNVGDAARIVTSMMAQFQASSSELTDYVDKLAKTSAVSKTSIDQLKYALNYVGTAARSANQPFYEIVAAAGALSTAGVEASQAGTTLRDMLSDLTDTTSYSSRKLQALGLDMSKIDPRANKLSEIIGTLRARGIDAADAMAIFGVRGGLAAGSLITVYKQYLEVLNAVQNQSKGTAAIMQQDVTDNLRKDFDRLVASFDYMVNRIFRSGLGDFMRGVTKQAKELTIQIADIVDTLKNAAQFGDIGEIVSLSLKIGFGTALNYLMGGLVSGFQILGQMVLSDLKIISNVQFWSGLFDIVESLGSILRAAMKLAMANFIDSNTEFSTLLIQNILYAGDLFVHKMQEAAGVIRGIASPSYIAAKIEAQQAGLKVRTAQQSSKSTDVFWAAQDLKLEQPGTQAYQQAQAKLDQALAAYNTFMEPLLRAQEDAIQKLKQESDRLGIVGEYTGTKEQFAAQAATMVATAPNEMRASAQEDIAKAKAELPGAATALADIFTKGLAQPLVDAVKQFEPVELVSNETLERQRDRLKTIFKENAPTPAIAPTKTLEKVIGGRQSGGGVGEIKLSPESTGTLNLVVGSMKELGSGIWVSRFGAVMSPAERATKENTAAITSLTNAIKAGPAEQNLKEDTKGIKPKPAPSSAQIESENKTDLGVWAKTGMIPDRFRKKLDAQRQIEREQEAKRLAEEQQNAQINNQQLQRQNISNITSTIGTRMSLGNPLLLAVKKGIGVAFDENGKPIPQSGLSLGQPVTTALGYKASGTEINAPKMLDIVDLYRKGASFRLGDPGATPESITLPMLDKTRSLYPINDEFKQQLLYGAPLIPSSVGMGPGLTSTPDISDIQEKNGRDQLAELSDIKQVLTTINNNIIQGNRQEGQKLSIKIT